MNLNWFLSGTVRHATQMRKHVTKILCAQRDILAPAAVEAVTAALRDIEQACATTREKPVLLETMSKLETVANKWLKAYPNAGVRENIEVLLVAMAVAMGIRTFFVQPFKIPTGSMQPTLFGITHENLLGQRDVVIPNAVSRFINYWISGEQYIHVVAKNDGPLSAADENPQRFLLFNLKQSIYIGGVAHTVWFPPENFLRRTELKEYLNRLGQKVYKRGEDVIKLKVISGDHLFVDRLTYNFRRPKRGEIIVFETRGIPPLPPDQFYIKRMVAMDGDRVRIGNDRHLIIDDKRLDSNTPHFELVYDLDGGPPEDSKFSGHVNNLVARQNRYDYLAPLFPDDKQEFVVKPRHYLVMGDNTVNSFDSRSWGDFPQENVIGKSFCVYWPIGSQQGRTGRFGWSHR